MDGLRLIKGAAPLRIAVGRDAGARPYCPSAKVRILGPRANGGDGHSCAMETTTAAVPPARQSYAFPLQLRRLWSGSSAGADVAAMVEKGNDDVLTLEVKGEEEEKNREEESVVPPEENEEAEAEQQRGNWVMKILRVGSLWTERRQEEEEQALRVGDQEKVGVAAEYSDPCIGCGCGCDEGCAVGEDEERMVFDRESFSPLLRKVSLSEAELYAKTSYLGNLAYIIPKIKPKNLLKCYGLRFVTSSLENKGKTQETIEEQNFSRELSIKEETMWSETDEVEKLKKDGNGVSASAAYRIAASAASYIRFQTKSIFLFNSCEEETEKLSEEECKEIEGMSHQEASFVATKNSVTAMVARKEEMKQALVKDLNSAKSSPCEWFITDDEGSSTRYFVIQGSDSLASWQANLLFEPIQFEGFDVLVHRGIYEAAKGIYQQILPAIKAHLQAHGDSATFRFTGHSLGGSLALLLNLMLLIRGEAKASSLLPVITFGAPSIMCGGDYLLRKLGLPMSHVQVITLHRDIVPRAFSCSYPDSLAKILKAVSSKFRNDPCLVSQKFLYAPMGKFLILQPEERVSPHHPLLPPGSGFYILDNSSSDTDLSTKLLKDAQSAFLNSPHPLEILSDRSAYGIRGTVYKDHDMKCYLRSIRNLIRQELKLARQAEIERGCSMLWWWPLVATQVVDPCLAAVRRRIGTISSQHHFIFADILDGGRETMRQYGRLVAIQQRMNMFVLLLLPVRQLLLWLHSLLFISDE